MTDIRGRVVRVKSINGDEKYQKTKIPVIILKLIITTEITGYTCQFIYGDQRDLDYESLVVPTYKLNVEKNGKIIGNYNVTRDSWYSRGVIKDNWGPYDDIELSNRCFEPLEKTNLYSTVPSSYPPGAGVDALALREKKIRKT